MGYDTGAIKEKHLLSDVIGRRIELKKNGKEYQACCPFHDENTPSFSVNDQKGFYYCFGCGATGDVVDFVMEYDGLKFKEACEKLGGEDIPSGDMPERKPPTKIDYYDGFTPVTPVPDAGNTDFARVFNPKRLDDPKKRIASYPNPSMIFPYHDKSGQIIGYVLRIDLPDGKKLTPSIMWCTTPRGKEGWCHYPLNRTGLLFNAHEVENKDLVLMCEGEKAASAAARLMPKYAGSCWTGGTNGQGNTDWSALKDKSVVLWPDADDVGIEAMAKVAKLIMPFAKEIKFIDTRSQPKGWDLADAEREGWTSKEVVAFAKKHLMTYSPKEDDDDTRTNNNSDGNKAPPKRSQQKASNGSPGVSQTRHQAPEKQEAEAQQSTDSKPQGSSEDNQKQKSSPEPGNESTGDSPFRFLGYNQGRYFYLPTGTQQIVALTPSQHTPANFLSLAGLEYWVASYGDGTKVTKDGWNFAANAMMRYSESTGLFDPHEQMRGRGAWIDKGRVIMHMGSSSYVDGRQVLPHKIKSRYVYELSTDLGLKLGEAATDEESNALLDICKRLNWEDPISGRLLAGWLVIAPVCGVLKWRPHIWITGESGAGKSTVLKQIMKPVLGDVAIETEGKSTEAGIRQALQQDARPILVDEAEAESQEAGKRMQDVIDLARISSSGGRILKGTSEGKSMSFSIRSCFCFSSINTSVKHFADETRITKLFLCKDKNEDAEMKYDKLVVDIQDLITPEFSHRMLMRSLKNLTTLTKNIEVFSKAAIRVFRSAREADQIGAMLAGTYMCVSTKELSVEQAETWLRKQDWTGHTSVSEKTDAERLLDYIATHRVLVDGKGGKESVSIGELILIANDKERYGHICTGDTAELELKRFGIKVEMGEVLISNKSDPMRSVLRGKQWESEWGRPLRTLAGAKASDNIVYFSPGIKARATIIPIGFFTDE